MATIAVLWACIVVPMAGALAASVTVTVMVDGAPHTVGLTSFDVQGVQYLSLPALMRQAGGTCKVMPAYVQGDLGGGSATANINDVRVEAATTSFVLQHPLVRRDRDIMIAVSDIAPYLTKAFRVEVRAPGQEPVVPPPADATAPSATAEPTPAERPQPATGTEAAVEPSPLNEPGNLTTPLPTPQPEPAPATPAEPGANPAPMPEPAKEPGNLTSEPPPVKPAAEPAAEPAATPAPNVHMGPVEVLVLDPGHGGNDPGCVGPDGAGEKDICLAVALQVQKLLKAQKGLKVVLTRSDDRDMTIKQRIDFANQQQGSLLVSLHLGASFAAQAHGVEAFVPKGATANNDAEYHARCALFAKHLLDALANKTGADTRGVEEAPLRLFRGLSMPVCLVEMGFITNPSEESSLTNEGYRAKLAEGVAEGIGQGIAATAGGAQ